MASSKTEVDIELKANVQQLISALSKVEDISAKQAKALVRDVEKANAAMERAANKAARTQKKAIDRASKEAEEKTGHVLDIMQKSATEMSSVFGVGFLGDVEGLLDVTRQSGEKLGMSLTTVFAGIGVAVGLGIAAIQQMAAHLRETSREVAASADALRGYVDLDLMDRVDAFAEELGYAEAAMAKVKAETALSSDELISFERHVLGVTSLGLPEWLSEVAAMFTKYYLSAGQMGTVGQLFGASVEHMGSELIEEGKAAKQAEAANKAWAASVEQMAGEEKKAENAAAIQAKADATDAQARARRRLAEAGRISAAIQAEINEETAREEVEQKEALKALLEADQIRSKSATTQLDDRGKLNESLDRQMATIQKSIDLNGENVISTDAMAQALAAYNQQLDVLDEKETAAKLAETSAQVNLAAQSITQLAGAASTFADLALDRFSAIAEAEAERFSTLQDQRVEARTQEIADMLETGDITQAQADQKLSMMERNEQARADNHQNLSKDQRKAAKRAFAVGQAAALAGVVASGAQAYMALLASFAYLNVGAPAAALAITGPAVIAQTAVVLANKPPQFNDGGMVTPDHRLISAQPGEAVVSRRGVAALGGPSGLSELNKGMGSGGSMTANIVIDRRIIGQAVADIVPSSMTRRSGRIAVYGG